jgi:hypothetical protein
MNQDPKLNASLIQAREALHKELQKLSARTKSFEVAKIEAVTDADRKNVFFRFFARFKAKISRKN